MSNIRIAELDFDQIKNNLKTYLKSQDEFTDYDFEGSGLSVLLDILAYNTHYNAFLANMVVNEMFLDSAVKRASAVSIAKHLGYTPTSARGSRANIDVTVTNPSGLPSILTLDRYTPFTTTIEGVAYTFLTNQATTTSRVGNTYTFTDVEIIEGALLSYRYVVAVKSPSTKYEIPDNGVDTTTLQVLVQTSATDTTTTTYTLATDITGIDSESEVYFLEQNPQGRYEIFFGDGLIGKQPDIGNIVIIQYISVSGSAPNVSGLITQTFTPGSTIGGSSSIVVTTNSNSTGGADQESITSIKFNAPRVNAAKNRAVTASDYESLIAANYPGAESISVWGGEDNDPPYYGKILISLKPFEGYVISDATKESIKSTILRNRKMLTVTPEFIDPLYIYVNITGDVRYNSIVTTLSSEEIKSSVITTIEDYFSNNLQKFNKTFNYSKLIESILNTNTSIDSVVLTIRAQRRITPVLSAENTYTGNSSIKFRNPIRPGTISSSYFYVVHDSVQTLVKIVDLPDQMPPSDTGTGTLRLVSVATGITVVSNLGTVNYSSGNMEITSITPTSVPSNIIDIRILASIQESSYNIVSSRNEVLVLDDTAADGVGGLVSGINITVLPNV